MVDPGLTCSIINEPTYRELNNIGQKLALFKSQSKAKTYNGSEIRMLGHTLIVSCFDTDGKYPTNHKVWITEERTVNLLGIDFCHLFLKALYFDIPAVELKSEDGVISYGLLNNDKEYPNVSKIETIRLKDPYISHTAPHICINIQPKHIFKRELHFFHTKTRVKLV